MATVTGITPAGVTALIAELGPSGKELAYAEVSTEQSGIGGTLTDITGLTITFTVGTRPVHVESYSPVVYASAAPTNILLCICDGAGTVKKQTGFYFNNTLDSRFVIVRERITAAGTYTRKLRAYRNVGSGNIFH